MLIYVAYWEINNVTNGSCFLVFFWFFWLFKMNNLNYAYNQNYGFPRKFTLFKNKEHAKERELPPPLASSSSGVPSEQEESDESELR